MVSSAHTLRTTGNIPLVTCGANHDPAITDIRYPILRCLLAAGRDQQNSTMCPLSTTWNNCLLASVVGKLSERLVRLQPKLVGVCGQQWVGVVPCSLWWPCLEQLCYLSIQRVTVGGSHTHTPCTHTHPVWSHTPTHPVWPYTPRRDKLY